MGHLVIALKYSGLGLGFRFLAVYFSIVTLGSTGIKEVTRWGACEIHRINTQQILQAITK